MGLDAFGDCGFMKKERPLVGRSTSQGRDALDNLSGVSIRLGGLGVKDLQLLHG